MITIIDYGMGNIHSVQKAMESLGAGTQVVESAREIAQAGKLVLPGVGAFDDAMQVLKAKGLVPAIREYAASGKALLGICLGMQLFFDTSAEAVRETGLGIMAGSVEKFDPAVSGKVPHMGWNRLTVSGKSPLMAGIPQGAYVYFCHSYYCAPREDALVAARASYGVECAAVVQQGNVYGVQFHPEKSQDVGLQILRNFIAL
jgi:imidazole glycerol-phosphate synthase subunit HisH